MLADINELNLFIAVMNYGKGSKMLKFSKKTKAISPTLFLGDGTVRNELLNKLGLIDLKKEIFLAIVDPDTEKDFYERMENKFQMNKQNHGIAFSIPLTSFSKIKDKDMKVKIKNESVNTLDYEAIFAIVDKGLSHELVDAAQAAGSSGGTIVHARGAGNTEKAKLFNLDIEPEKEIVLILTEEDSVDQIVQAIKNQQNLSDPGTGILFVLDVNKAVGLYQANS